MKRYVLELQNKTILGNDYVSFEFKKPDDLEYLNGQYGVFLHVGKDVEGRKMRAFSFASPVTEKTMVIGTKIVSEPSDFKRLMLELEIGDTMTVDGPMGNFTLEPSKPSVFIAGGIGITPIRALSLALNDSTLDHVLIYSEHNGHYPYQEDLQKVPFTDAYYVTGLEDTKQTIDHVAKQYMNEAVYYMSGSPGFINGIMGQLQDLGIDNSNLKYDRFTGY